MLHEARQLYEPCLFCLLLLFYFFNLSDRETSDVACLSSFISNKSPICRSVYDLIKRGKWIATSLLLEASLFNSFSLARSLHVKTTKQLNAFRSRHFDLDHWLVRILCMPSSILSAGPTFAACMLFHSSFEAHDYSAKAIFRSCLFAIGVYPVARLSANFNIIISSVFLCYRWLCRSEEFSQYIYYTNNNNIRETSAGDFTMPMGTFAQTNSSEDRMCVCVCLPIVSFFLLQHFWNLLFFRIQPTSKNNTGHKGLERAFKAFFIANKEPRKKRVQIHVRKDFRF